MASRFQGCALCEVDGDGKVLLSDGTAAALGLPGRDEPLFLSPHERDRCLVGYSRTRLQEIRTRTGYWQLADDDRPGGPERLQRLFGLVELAPRTDRAIQIPAAMRRLGQIESIALLVGAGDRFEIWNPRLAMASADVRPMLELPYPSPRHAPRAGSRRIRPFRD